jgi:hypothetical protein
VLLLHRLRLVEFEAKKKKELLSNWNADTIHIRVNSYSNLLYRFETSDGNGAYPLDSPTPYPHPLK